MTQAHSKMKNLKKCKDAPRLFYIKRFKKCKAESAVSEGAFRHICVFKASFGTKFQFVLHDTCFKSLTKNKT